MELTPLHERLLAAAGNRTYRALGELTSTNAETVRRYMQGQAPSAEFLAGFCTALGLSAQWLLCGRGPMKNAHVQSHALREASASELLSAMAATLERLTSRVERMELYLHALEVRVRGGALAGRKAERMADSEGARDAHGQHTTPAAEDRDPARFVADAVAQRPRSDHH